METLQKNGGVRIEKQGRDNEMPAVQRQLAKKGANEKQCYNLKAARDAISTCIAKVGIHAIVAFE